MFPRQVADRVEKAVAAEPLVELDDVAAPAASAEAIPTQLAGIDRQGGGLLVVEWADRQGAAPARFQLQAEALRHFDRRHPATDLGEHVSRDLTTTAHGYAAP